MKYMVISDIHGSVASIEKALHQFEVEQADYLIILGDHLYHGPRNPLPENYNPLQVSELLNRIQERIIAVRGNCDSEVDQMVLKFSMMKDLEVIHDTRDILISHGHIYHPDHLPDLMPNQLFLFGHIHLPIAIKQNGYYIGNPGSITFPKDNHPPTYGLIENDSWIIKTLDGNIYKNMSLLD